MSKSRSNYGKSRSFIYITYSLYHALDVLKGQAKSNCINVFMALMKYAWKSKGYKCGVRYSTLAKDTTLSMMTVRRSIYSLAKLNIITKRRLPSANEYSINTTFLKEESLRENRPKSMREQSDSTYLHSINRNNNTLTNIDKIISKGLDKETTIKMLADTVDLPDLISDKRNVYYCKLAIALKEENDKPKINLNTGAILKGLKKQTNQFYKSKVDYNKRNNIKPWEK